MGTSYISVKVAWEGTETGGSINLRVTFGESGWFCQGGLALQAVSLLYETSEELQQVDCDRREEGKPEW